MKKVILLLQKFKSMGNAFRVTNNDKLNNPKFVLLFVLNQFYWNFFTLITIEFLLKFPKEKRSPNDTICNHSIRFLLNIQNITYNLTVKHLFIFSLTFCVIMLNCSTKKSINIFSVFFPGIFRSYVAYI